MGERRQVPAFPYGEGLPGRLAAHLSCLIKGIICVRVQEDGAKLQSVLAIVLPGATGLNVFSGGSRWRRDWPSSSTRAIILSPRLL
jgi:hypothetical protein